MRQTLSEHVTTAVRAEVRRQGVTQRWIGEQLELSQTQIWERMRGEIEWRTSELERLAAALNVPVTAFLPPADTAGSGPTHPANPRPSAPAPPPRPAKVRTSALAGGRGGAGS